MSLFRPSRIKLAGYSVVIVILTGSHWSSSAATMVRGDPDNLRVEVNNASIREILDALSAKSKLSYVGSSNLGHMRTGVFSGPLRQVLSRVLDGTDHIIRTENGRLEIIIIGKSRPRAVASGEMAAAPGEQAVPVAVTPAIDNQPKPPPLNSYLSAP